MNNRSCVLELDARQNIVGGSAELLRAAVARGADIRVSTGFVHNEHIDPSSPDGSHILETSTFPETVLVDGRWAACFMTLRQPVELRHGFGAPNTMSLFLYNEDGSQGMGRLSLDGGLFEAGDCDTEDAGFPKLRTSSIVDVGTRGGARNFIYDFEPFRFLAWDIYEELFANSPEGDAVSGDIRALEEAYAEGRAIKLAVTGVSRALWGDTGHEDTIFIHGSSSYDYTEDHLMISNSAPFVSVPADIPLLYRAHGHRYCWLIARSDGRVELRGYDPIENKWTTQTEHLAVRWFAAR